MIHITTENKYLIPSNSCIRRDFSESDNGRNTISDKFHLSIKNRFCFSAVYLLYRLHLFTADRLYYSTRPVLYVIRRLLTSITRLWWQVDMRNAAERIFVYKTSL